METGLKTHISSLERIQPWLFGEGGPDSVTRVQSLLPLQFRGRFGQVAGTISNVENIQLRPLERLNSMIVSDAGRSA